MNTCHRTHPTYYKNENYEKGIHCGAVENAFEVDLVFFDSSPPKLIMVWDFLVLKALFSQDASNLKTGLPGISVHLHIRNFILVPYPY